MVLQGLYALVLLLLTRANFGWSLPQGFHDEVFLDKSVIDFRHPMDFDFYVDRDGSAKLILVDRLGFVYWMDNPESSPEKQLILDISSRVCGDGSRGLLSAVLHPEFQTNRWLYVFYTRVTDGACNLDRETGPVNRVARYVVSTYDNTVDTSSELVILESSRTTMNFHNGGDMKFGKDGYLYITTGDGGLKSVSQDPSDLLGSVLRVTEDGSIPPGGNAFTSNVARCNVMGRPPTGQETARCAEIWAKGLRNPFRFAMDPNADETRFFIGDVGRGTWEEINEGGANFRGANYGWEEREGPCEKGSDTKCEISEYTDPVYWYIHDGIDGSLGGGAVVGGAFIPNGLWPDEYDGKYIFGDYVFEELYLLTPREPCRTGCGQPIPAFRNTTIHSYPKIIDAHFGPYFGTQALYYLGRDSDLGAIRRIIYTGTTGNRPPVPILTASSLYAEVGELVVFDASRSFDPDGDRMKFKFQFGQDKSRSWEKNPIVSYRFNEPGKQRIRMRIKDKPGDRDNARIDIFVGELPNAEIISPPPDTFFAVGDQLILSATATTHDGKALPDSSLSWEVRKHHNIHFHPFFDGNGNDLLTPHTPEPEDIFASLDSYLEVILRVAGTDGLEREVRRNVYPKIIEVDFDTSPSGLGLSIFDYDAITPMTVSCWENQRLVVEAVENPGYSFLRWSDGGKQQRVIHVSEGNQMPKEFVASYGAL